MKNEKTKQVVKGLLDHLEYYNNMAPFPVFDTDYVKGVKKHLDEVEESDIDYDSLPVEACKHCKSLYIVDDEDENAVCQHCNSINELKVYANIDEYLKEKNIWNG